MRILNLSPGELVVDSFAGGGGASTGIEQALGRPIDIAINHSPAAIAMHEANHPKTKHYCESIYEVDPATACGGRPVGFAWFSPACTHFSKAKGKTPLSNEIRGLAWVVVDWARAVRPRVIMLENVEEFEGWSPLDEEGYPIKERAGEIFREWLTALRELGYVVEFRTLIAADYGAPTTRKRLFLIARCDGELIVWPTPTHGKGRKFEHVPASSIVDWSLSCPSVFERRRPLAEKTMRRIKLGLERYVLDNAAPFIVKYYGTSNVEPITAPLSTVTSKGVHHALVAPTLIQTGYGERKGQTPRVLDLHKPLGAVVAGGAKHALVAAFITKHYGGMVGHGVERPLGTITTQDHHAVTTATLSPQGRHTDKVRALLGREPVLELADGTYTISDIGMRMFQPHELFAAQGFPGSYIIDPHLGGTLKGKALTKSQLQALVGNSVPPCMARVLVEANMYRTSASEAAA